MKVVMVTGGAGFIGSNFIKYFRQTYPEYVVLNYDKLTYAGNKDNVKELEGDSKYHFVQGDICDPKQVNKIIWEYAPDYVINFAAESHVDRSITDPLLFGRTNMMGTLNLLECLKNFWLDCGYDSKRFVQISTDEVYGSIDNEVDYFSEDSDLMPSSPYSASKASADLMVLAFFKTFNFPSMITRCSNNYGPYQNTEKFIPNCIIKALNDEPIPIYGDGTNIREWIHVGDHCAAVAKILFKGAPGEVYNIGSGEEVSNIEMAGIILDHLGKRPDAFLKVADRPGHDWRYALDCDKIRNKLEWKCRYSVKEGILDTIQWYKDNIAWWSREKP